MHKEESKKEQRILSQMRKTLGNIIKDVTPSGDSPNPLSDGTIQEIKHCFALISEREKELADKLGFDQAKPHYANGEQPSASVLNFVKLSKNKQ